MDPNAPPQDFQPLSRDAQGILAKLLTATFPCASTERSAPALTPNATLRLSFAPADSGCPLAAAPPAIMFRIEAAALDQVVAITPDGRVLHIFWSQGFQGGTPEDPAVRDPNGRVVARNGEVVIEPGRGIHGHTVCSGSDSLYEFLAVPT